MLPESLEHEVTARKRKTILVVEDEAIIRFDVSDYFRDHGYDVIEANSGEEAIEALKRNPAVALVFTDVRMPGRLDGIALARYVQEHHPEIPVLITSAHITPDELPPSFQPLIDKPYKRRQVLKIIEEKLK